jgi:lactate permease
VTAEINILETLLALLPLIFLLAGLGALKLPAHKAGGVALALTALIAWLAFGMQPLRIAEASLEGAALALFPIVWVVVSAVFVYNVAVSTGSMDVMKNTLSRLSPDRRVQALILAFGFGGFLEAVAGFGTAVAIPAGIMAAMGFEPLLAATVCLIANTIPVAFGVLGIPVIILAQTTGLALDKLTLYTALQLIPFIVLLPFVLIYAVTGSVRHIRGVVGLSLASGASFAAGQTLAAIFIGPELAAVVGSLAALAVMLAWTRLWPVRNAYRFKGDRAPIGEMMHEADESGRTGTMAKAVPMDALKTMPMDTSKTVPMDALKTMPMDILKTTPMDIMKTTPMDILKAWSPYIFVLALILAVKYLPFLQFLLRYPFTLSQQFYFGPGGKSQNFALATSGGTVLFLSAVVSGFLQGASLGKIIKVLGKTLKQLWKTALTILSVVMLAKIMGYSGMVGEIAIAAAVLAGPAFPLIAPLIGALGTFLTGSDTSSNVLFGGLQKSTALQLGISPEWLAAANASGATAGKMISPQSISIATSSTGLAGSESRILGTTIRYCLVYAILIGAIVLAFSWKV